ncbi:MAG: hypothetical protein JSS20_06415 [Proteobacteria bacterium]|nr:hypothetical protein [Pseudomonadota bacterium]
MKVDLNGHTATTIDVETGVAEKTYVVAVPTGTLSKDKPNKMVFSIGYPVSPAEAGLGADPRKLGVGLRQIEISFVPAVVYSD